MNKERITFLHRGEQWTHQFEHGNTIIRDENGNEVFGVAGTDNTEAIEWAAAGFDEGLKRAFQWRPIKTAPTDGTLILLYVGNAYGFNHVKVGLLKDGKAWSRYDDGEALGDLPEELVTHWMPLPPTENIP